MAQRIIHLCALCFYYVTVSCKLPKTDTDSRKSRKSNVNKRMNKNKNSNASENKKQIECRKQNFM